MFQDPLHDPRVRIAEQERKEREEKGTYQGLPFFTWSLITVIILVIAFAIILHAFHVF